MRSPRVRKGLHHNAMRRGRLGDGGGYGAEVLPLFDVGELDRAHDDHVDLVVVNEFVNLLMDVTALINASNLVQLPGLIKKHSC